ncbi:MAG: hypothetical protein AAB588_06665, partial [Patescibacteria group bacterium]
GANGMDGSHAAITSYSRYSHMPFAASILRMAAAKNPTVAISSWKDYRDSPVADEVLGRAIDQDPAHALDLYKFEGFDAKFRDQAIARRRETKDWALVAFRDRYNDRSDARSIFDNAIDSLVENNPAWLRENIRGYVSESQADRILRDVEKKLHAQAQEQRKAT